jgi:hypothetical protein
MAAIIMAALGFMARVDTQVAIALGASVHPLTNITPIKSRVIISSAGLDTNWLIKFEKVIVIFLPLVKRISFLRPSVVCFKALL